MEHLSISGVPIPDYSVRHVLAALRQLRTTIRLEMIGDGLSESDVGSLVNAALRSNTALQMTNNIVLCSLNNTLHILEQVGEDFGRLQAL